MINHYSTLGLSPTASYEEIKTAYRKLVFQIHPDRNEGGMFAEEYLKKINSAYEVLSIPEKKNLYDLELKKLNKFSSSISARKASYFHPKRSIDDRSAVAVGKAIVGTLILYVLLKSFSK